MTQARPGMIRYLRQLQADVGDTRPTPHEHNEVVAMTDELKQRKRQPHWEKGKGESLVAGRNTLVHAPRTR